MSEQQPQNSNKYEGMFKVLSNARTKNELEQMVLLYVFDMAYPRADIALALHNVERNLERKARS